jgi:DHA1 family bicyclomycin/chloramphenicol resistance-like MFS transporter
VPESLPLQRRHGGGLRAFAITGGKVLARRGYVGYVLVSGSGTGPTVARWPQRRCPSIRAPGRRCSAS